MDVEGDRMTERLIEVCPEVSLSHTSTSYSVFNDKKKKTHTDIVRCGRSNTLIRRIKKITEVKEKIKEGR